MSINRLAAKVAAVPLNNRGHRRYGEPLKREIMTALASSGLTHKDFAEQVGLPEANLCHWRDFGPAPATVAAGGSFKSIVVEPERPSNYLSLRAPGGVVVEGLTIDAAADLIAALAVRASC